MERAVCRFIQELSRYPLLSIDTNHVFTVHIITTFQTNFYLIVVECQNSSIVMCTFYIHNVCMFVKIIVIQNYRNKFEYTKMVTRSYQLKVGENTNGQMKENL